MIEDDYNEDAQEDTQDDELLQWFPDPYDWLEPPQRAGRNNKERGDYWWGMMLEDPFATH